MKKRDSFRQAVKGLFTLTPAQVRGLLVLLPLLAVIGIIIGTANRPHFEQSFLELVDETERTATEAPGAAVDTSEVARELFFFDPNTVTLQELCRLGFDTRTAAGIIKYRERGKRFEIPEDFATCYGVSLDEYTRLEPYIRIAGGHTVQRPAKNGGDDSPLRERDGKALERFDPNDSDAAGFVTLGFSPAQADVIVRYRGSIGGFRSAADFTKCYVVSDEMAARLVPYMDFAVAAVEDQEDVSEEEPAMVEINDADSVTLRSVSGIGEVLVVGIMEYRDRLGGFHNVTQLAEVKGMYEENFKRICEQICVDSCGIQKIDVNFAPHKTLVESMGRHPYVTDRMLRKLLKNRQLKGGWSSIGDMIAENIMTEEEAARLSPYLLFRSE